MDKDYLFPIYFHNFLTCMQVLEQNTYGYSKSQKLYFNYNLFQTILPHLLTLSFNLFYKLYQFCISSIFPNNYNKVDSAHVSPQIIILSQHILFQKYVASLLRISTELSDKDRRSIISKHTFNNQFPLIKKQKVSLP